MTGSPEFFPETSTMPRAGGYSGLYRFFSNQSWKYVMDPDTRKPAVFDRLIDAVTAAKDHLRRALNPVIQSDISIPTDPGPGIDPDVLEWTERKREEIAQANIMRRRSTMKPVVVERIRKRRPVKC